MFMIRGADIEEVDTCTDELVTYPTREEALEVLGIAKAVAEVTGIPLSTITRGLEEMVGAERSERALAQ